MTSTQKFPIQYKVCIIHTLLKKIHPGIKREGSQIPKKSQISDPTWLLTLGNIFQFFNDLVSSSTEKLPQVTISENTELLKKFTP
jgi:hypothetical protein